MKESFKYQFADSWILLAIIYAYNQKRSDLASIIAYGDYINHAIFTLEELQGGFFRLFRSEYVLKEKDGYIPSKKIVEFYKNSCTNRKVVMKELECVQEGLKMPDWDSKYDPRQANKDGIYKEITQEVYDNAMAEYKSSFKNLKKFRGHPIRGLKHDLTQIPMKVQPCVPGKFEAKRKKG